MTSPHADFFPAQHCQLHQHGEQTKMIRTLYMLCRADMYLTRRAEAMEKQHQRADGQRHSAAERGEYGDTPPSAVPPSRGEQPRRVTSSESCEMCKPVRRWLNTLWIHAQHPSAVQICLKMAFTELLTSCDVSVLASYFKRPLLFGSGPAS